MNIKLKCLVTIIHLYKIIHVVTLNLFAYSMHISRTDVKCCFCNFLSDAWVLFILSAEHVDRAVMITELSIRPPRNTVYLIVWSIWVTRNWSDSFSSEGFFRMQPEQVMYQILW